MCHSMRPGADFLDVRRLCDFWHRQVTICEGDVISSPGETIWSSAWSNPLLSLNCLPTATLSPILCWHFFKIRIFKKYFASGKEMSGIILILLWCFHSVRESVSYLVENKLIYPLCVSWQNNFHSAPGKSVNFYLEFCQSNLGWWWSSLSHHTRMTMIALYMDDY